MINKSRLIKIFVETTENEPATLNCPFNACAVRRFYRAGDVARHACFARVWCRAILARLYGLKVNVVVVVMVCGCQAAILTRANDGTANL